ncbi:hypothetical protein GCM10028812_15960 [Ancylobacter sonchi]
MPPAIWNDAMETSMASSSQWPASAKNTSTKKAMITASIAAFFRAAGSSPAVTARKTGKVPIGSMTTQKVTNSCRRSDQFIALPAQIRREASSPIGPSFLAIRLAIHMLRLWRHEGALRALLPAA